MMRRWILVGLAMSLAVFLTGCGGSDSSSESRELLVGSSANGKILRYDADSGAYIGEFASGGSLVSPNGMDQLPNGDVIVGDFVTHHVLEYTATGVFKTDLGEMDGTPYGVLALNDGSFLVSIFDSGEGAKGKVVKFTPGAGFTTFAEGGTLDGPDGLTLGKDGRLYVSSEKGGQILRYDLAGNYLGVFATGSPLGAPNAGPSGTVFGPDGNLYVAQHDTNPVATTNGMVLRYNGTTGAFIDQVVPEHSGGLSGPVGVAFTSNGRLLVTSAATNQVLAYSTTGTPLGAFASSADLQGPIYITQVKR